MSVCHGYIKGQEQLTCDQTCIDYPSCPIRQYFTDSFCWYKKQKKEA